MKNSGWRMDVVLFAAGRTDPAIEHYRLAIRQYRGNAQANHNLGALFAGRGDLDREGRRTGRPPAAESGG